MRSPTVLCQLAAPLLMVAAHATSADVPSGTYVLDETHGYITFSYSHLGFSTPHVGFTDFAVTLNYDAEAPERSRLNVIIQADSVDSRVAEFNEHLVDERFFHTTEYPTITFDSTAIEMTGDNTGQVTGNLTIRDQTHPVTLDVTLNKAANHPMRGKPFLGFNAQTEVMRSQWGLDYAVPAVGDAVDLYISVELMAAE
jgi:polyisoprenoid-binding protein YceI